ncbi:MAG: hypothetical protein OCD02_05755 [Spirochaetaceae bacterium]
MEVLYGTTNISKIDHMKQMLDGSGIKIVTLNGLDTTHIKIIENGLTPRENAIIKAKAYYKAIKTPVFACDSALYFENVKPEHQPGTYVRRVNGKELTDEQMIEYYSKLAKQYGGKIIAYYQNAICLIINDDEIYSHQGEDISTEKFYISDTPKNFRHKGFPLDSLSYNIRDNRHKDMADGFKTFLLRHL